MKCEWCGLENNDKITIVIDFGSGDIRRFKTCAECLNLYGSREYGELTRRLREREGIINDYDRKIAREK